MSRINLVAEPGSHEIITSREFNAPRDLVFKVMTDPTLIPQWWGLRSTTTTVDRMDLQMGGLWRFVERAPDGTEYGFRGVYHQVQAPERTVSTFEFEGMPGHICMETLTLEERDGKTLITNSSVFQSVEDRDGMLQSGMEGGATESWDQLEEVLQAELQSQ